MSRTEYWIDGYNVILRLRLGQGRSMQERRAELVYRTATLRQPCWVVFDARERTRSESEFRNTGRVRVTFARDGKTADEVLVDRLKTRRDLRGVVVVSDDREIVNQCRFHGAGSMAVAEFASKLLPVPDKDEKTDRPLSKHEVEDWMRYFGLDAEEPDPKEDPT